MFHKASLDKKSPAVLAKLAKQTALMYGEVSGLFAAPVIQNHFEKSWGAHTQVGGERAAAGAAAVACAGNGWWVAVQVSLLLPTLQQN